MTDCFFVADLHGRRNRYKKLFEAIAAEQPAAVFLGGDLLPHAHAGGSSGTGDFIRDELKQELQGLIRRMGPKYPRVFSIMGNDDVRIEEPAFRELEELGLWEYIHNRRVTWQGHELFGYAYVPPTPFLLKDWERYDLSRYVDPGCVPLEEGRCTIPVSEREQRLSTIKADLDLLAGEAALDRAVFMFHSPPHGTNLDQANLAGVKVDGVELDSHVGSVAIRRFIEGRQPLLTLHGHIHESARLTGSWRDRIGRTELFSAAHDGPELALVKFSLEDLEHATRVLR